MANRLPPQSKEDLYTFLSNAAKLVTCLSALHHPVDPEGSLEDEAYVHFGGLQRIGLHRDLVCLLSSYPVLSERPLTGRS